MSDLLLVMDVQNAFAKPSTEPVIEIAKQSLDVAREHNVPVAFTRFINTQQRNFVRRLHWSQCMSEPDNLLVDGLAKDGETVFEKFYYTAFTEEFEEYRWKNKVRRLFIMGFDTEAGVLKTALDAFERDMHPIVIMDGCASVGGQDRHEAGLLALRKTIGFTNVIHADEFAQLLKSQG